MSKKFNKKFLVTVIGSQNTGKSTFIKDIIKKYSNNPIYEPFVTDECDYRKVIEEKHLSINREGNIESQRIIFDCLSQQVIDAIRNPLYKNVIFDRSPIDAFVYTKYLYDKGKVEKSDIFQMAFEMRKFAAIYDSIIYIPLDRCDNIKVVDDKFRDTDLDYRKYVDKLFREAQCFLDCNTLNKIIEISGTREERIERFYNMLSDNFVVKDSWVNNID